MVIRRSWTLVALLGLVLGISLVSWADNDADSHRPLTDTDYVDTTLGKYGLHPAFEKLGRGISNILGGWLEIPLNIQHHYSTRDTAGSIAIGMVYGAVYAVYRTGVGVYETATFLLPYPENYEPILPPVPYFTKDERRKPLLWE